jgi:MATE family multidrug resistance protein
MGYSTSYPLSWQDLRWDFFRLASVNILSNLMVPLSGLLSVAFLGHLTEIHHLAGVTLSTILFNYLYRTLGFLRMSTTGVTAQAIGRQDEEAVWLTGLRNSILALGLGVVLLLLQHPLGSLGFALLSAAPEVKTSGQVYYAARIWGAPATLLNFVLVGWFLGRGQSGKVFLLSAVGNGANVVLDYLFIVRWHWQSAGAGLATAVSQYLMMLVGLLLVCREVPWKKMPSLVRQTFVLAGLREMLSLNRDIFIRTLAFLSTFSLFTSLSSVMGETVLAENALLLQVITLTVYLVDGLAFATESLTGIFKGQGENEQLFPLLRIAGQVSLLVGLSFAVLCILFPETLFGLLTNHGEVIAVLHLYTPWLLPILGFGSIAFIMDGYFLGLAEGAILRNTALGATLLGFVPIAGLAWQLHSCSLLWLALSLFMAMRVIFLGLQVPRTLSN